MGVVSGWYQVIHGPCFSVPRRGSVLGSGGVGWALLPFLPGLLGFGGFSESCSFSASFASLWAWLVSSLSRRSRSTDPGGLHWWGVQCNPPGEGDGRGRGSFACGYLPRPKFFEKSAFFGFWASFRGWWAVGLWKIWELLGWRRCDLRRIGRTEGPTTPNRP